MIADGKLVRVDVEAGGVATSSGISMGDSEAHARQLYGSGMNVTPRKDVDPSHHLTVRSTDGHYGIRFETDNGKITTLYAGTVGSHAIPRRLGARPSLVTTAQSTAVRFRWWARSARPLRVRY